MNERSSSGRLIADASLCTTQLATFAGDHNRKSGGDSESLAESVEEVVDERPWLQPLTRVGWLAKGGVYALMGAAAYSIGRSTYSDDEASPEGALAQVIAQPGGRLLLSALVVGLALYVLWRSITAVLVTGHGVKEWLDRIGYAFSASFYALLAFTAMRAVASGSEPESNSIERISAAMLRSGVGRAVLLVVGVVAVVVGAYFAVEKGLRRSFEHDLEFDGAPPIERRLVIASGVVGWIGRGFVTSAVGCYIVQAAWQRDQGDARGFDRALREVAASNGGVLVSVAGVALIVYGVYCAASLRHRELATSRAQQRSSGATSS
jgi:hypothetical protein